MDFKMKGEGVDIGATLQEIDRRLLAIEQKLWPPPADGSGTERYDHWTQHSDGTDYPGSYGVGPLKPFAVTEAERTRANWTPDPPKKA
jgi:hypothetical protein